MLDDGVVVVVVDSIGLSVVGGLYNVLSLSISAAPGLNGMNDSVDIEFLKINNINNILIQ